MTDDRLREENNLVINSQTPPLTVIHHLSSVICHASIINFPNEPDQALTKDGQQEIQNSQEVNTSDMKKMMLLIFILSSCRLFAQTDSIPPFVRDSLDVYATGALTDWQIPAIAVCIVKNGKIVVMKGYGVTQAGTNNKVDEHTLFLIGSNTKAFTGTALAMLEAEKKLSLDDRVTKWIPEFKLNNKLAGEQAIIRDLLCHRIGFQTFQGDFTYWTSNLSRKEVIEKMSRIKAPYEFRTKWGYTNASFVVAGEIIPKAIGKTWEEFLKERIFDPLGMSRTLALSKDLSKAVNIAKAYTLVNDQLTMIPYAEIDNLAPAGSIASSVNDMSKWVMMQLDNGRFNGKEIVSSAAIGQTRLPHSIIGNGGSFYNKGHFALYGLGWLLEEYSGRKIISHTGGVNGFVTSVTLIPEEKLGIIVFTNTDQNAFYEALKWEIMDAYLGNIYRNYSKVYLNINKSQRAIAANKDKQLKDSAMLKLKPTLSLNDYTGSYSNEVYGDMNVVMENNELRMKFSHHPNMHAKLEALGGNRFYATFSDPEFSKAVFPFHVQDGKVKSVTVKVADFIEYNPYEFQKK